MRRRRPAVAAALTVAALAGCSDDGGGDVESFCATAREFVVDDPAAAFAAYDPADPGAAVEPLRAAAGRLRPWAEDAPGDVADDVEALADAADRLADAFAGTPSDEVRAELEATVEEVEGASARVRDFTQERCGVALDPTAGATPPTATPPAPP